MSFRILDAVYDWVAADTGAGGFCNTSTGVGARFYHLSGPENMQEAIATQLQTLPCCVFIVSDPSDVRRSFSDSATEEQWRLTFSIWVSAETSNDVVALGLDDALRDRLENKSLTLSSYDRAVVTNIRRGACDNDEDAIRVDSEWLVRATRTAGGH